MRKRPSSRLKERAAWALAAALFLATAEGVYRLVRIVQPFNEDVPSWTGDSFDLYALGGSIAFGYPYSPMVAFPNIVGQMFAGRIAGRPIAVRTIASPGDTIAADAYYFRQTLRRGRPGAALVYSCIDRPTPARHARLFALLERARSGPLGRSLLLSDALFFVERHWRLGGDSDRGYEEALRRIVRDCRDAGISPILATVALEVAGREPAFGGLPRDPGLAAGMAPVLELERRGSCAAAERAYAALAVRYPWAQRFFAYRVGRCWERAGAYEKAKARYETGSADFQIAALHERIMERVARDYGVPLIKTQELFESRSPHGLAGPALFDDRTHPSLAGHLILAEAFAQELSRAVHEPARRSFRDPDDFRKAILYPNGRRACGLDGAGFLALNGVDGIPYMFDRLAFAEDAFRAALAASPGDPTALLGLGMARAAERAAHTPPPADAYRIESVTDHDEFGGVECPKACLTAPTKSSARSSLGEAGLSGPDLDKIVESVPLCR